MDEDEQMFFFFKSDGDFRLVRLFNLGPAKSDDNDPVYEELKFLKVPQGGHLADFCGLMEAHHHQIKEYQSPKIFKLEGKEYLYIGQYTREWTKNGDEEFAHGRGIVFVSLEDMRWEREFANHFTFLGWREGFVIMDTYEGEDYVFVKKHLRDENHQDPAPISA